MDRPNPCHHCIQGSLIVFACIFLQTDSRAIEDDETVLARLMNDTKPDLSRLVQVQLLFRHGDRSPIGTYPTDTHQEDAWPQGFGQLTERGVEDAIVHGQYLRKRYGTFISEEYQRSEVYVRSTDKDRTLMTAESVLAGLFSPPAPLSGRNFSIVAVPIHTEPVDKDQLMGASPCPRGDELFDQWKVNSPLYHSYVQQNEAMFQRLSKPTGMNVTADTVSTIKDSVFCEVLHNMTQPEWIQKEYDQLIKTYDYFTGFQVPTKSLQRLSSGPLLLRFLQNMEGKLVEDKSHPKFIIYSGHDSTVMSMLKTMGVGLDRWAAYLATLMVELYKVGNLYYVRLLYRNGGVIKIVQAAGCDLVCREAQFRRVLDSQTLREEDREAACLPFSSLPSGAMGLSDMDFLAFLADVVPIAVAVALASLVVLFGCCYLVASQRLGRCLKCGKGSTSTNSTQYHQLQQEVQELLNAEEEDEL